MFNNTKITQLELKISQLELDKSNLSQAITNWSDKYTNLSDRYNLINKELQALKQYNISDEILAKKDELFNIQSQIDNINSTNYIQTLGLYELKNDSKYYQDELNENRNKQKLMLSNKEYYKVSDKWMINGNIREGTRLLEFLLKITVTSFNILCDNTLDKTNIINQKYLADRISRVYDSYNKELSLHKVELSSKYLQLKLDEIKIRLNIYIAKQNEKEEENRRKEILREQIKCEAEIKKNKDKLSKELLHYQIQLNKGADVQDKIDDIEARIETEDYMLANSRSGFVYIISNPSLGKDIYKIGITRRVSSIKGDDSPCAERINELSGSNIPFKFKPNCVMWCDDCFKLEADLHKQFSQYRVNVCKIHREFFKLPLSQIEKVVKEKYVSDAIFEYDVIDEDFIISGYKLSENFLTDDK